jgi:hypothetical protein
LIQTDSEHLRLSLDERSTLLDQYEAGQLLKPSVSLWRRQRSSFHTEVGDQEHSARHRGYHPSHYCHIDVV